MGGREDDDYWNDKYDNAPECEENPDHGDSAMLYDVGRWFCCECAYAEEE